MGSEQPPKTSIDGYGRTVREILSNKRYAIDYYQREYKWQTKQIEELLNDLGNKFLASYDEKDELTDVLKYGHYFLGSIIISEKGTENFIIDGQQRLTTLTLLFIYLYHQIDDIPHKGQVTPLIYSYKAGRSSFNIEVPERNAVLDSLFNQKEMDENGQPESVANILLRYRDIKQLFPEEIRGEAIRFFVDWLMENVHLVEIKAYSDEDAYTIFETMNDRGLALTATDMLRGYLLANIRDEERRNKAGQVWKSRTTQLKEIGREEDADAIKAWLRSQYANTIRERKRGAKPEDFDLIGTEFHRWIREHEKQLALEKSSHFADFIERDFAFYAHWYYTLRQAAIDYTPGLEFVLSNANLNFTLQYPVLLAPLCVGESKSDSRRKLRITGAFLDIMLARRIWNWRSIDYSTMQYAMFLIMRDIRRKSAAEVAERLTKRLADEPETFSSNPNFYLTGTNRWRIHILLARMTEYIETQSGMPSRFAEYIGGRGKHRYHVEHIWADKPERHIDEFPFSGDFEAYRNRIGGLLLLPGTFNESYNDLPYRDKDPKRDKREHYLKQNLLAQSLHEQGYERNPGFQQYIQNSGLPFRPHPEFGRADLDERQRLYRLLAEKMWDPSRLEQELNR